MKKALLFLGKLLLAIFLVAGIIALASLGGCAVFHEPPLPSKVSKKQFEDDYLPATNTTPVLCWYERDGVAWWMTRPRNECAGWTPL